ncbi:MAG TPA: hypothetical protein G4O03_05330 [Dehalococcoidia bacterium]|jgi:hypothetical protein|nr:hypothetical protein [Dehalococcoidia bacterium]
MSENLRKAEEIAENIRHEPYVLFRYDCILKSLEFKRRCRESGITARMVVCLGLGRARWFGHWLTIPVVHAWGEVEGTRIETSRPLGSAGKWGIIPVNIRPLLAVWI